jgi:hypothetical protein
MRHDLEEKVIQWAKDKNLIDPSAPGEVEEGFEYIITKKPKAKKVVKYLQDMANCIMAEADA